ncbi:MAG: ankyrin repeat domain-containing protein [Pyrinomonadaceae bacterium]
MKRKALVDSLKVTSPCNESWEQMTGNDRVRFCSHCDLNVNNLSEMTRKEAFRLVRRSEGRICVRYFENPKTKAPVFADRLYQITRSAGITAGILGASLATSTLVYAQGNVGERMPNQVVRVSAPDGKTAEPKTDGGTAQISGTVIDQQGAVIPGATVTLSGKDFKKIVTTNDSGVYLFSNVPSGDFSLTIESNGFKPYETEVTAAEGRETAANATLEVGEIYAVAGGIGMVDYQQPLLRAVSEEDFEEVNRLIAEGADVNARDKNYDGITALFVAVESGNLKMVETLLNFGAKVNVKSDDKRTPLMSLDGDAAPELVNLLLRYNAKAGAVDKEGNNALHFAAENDNAEIIRILIREGADINAQNEEGETPLMIAAYYENPETVKALLSAGAKVNLRNKEKETALGIAKGEEAEEIIKILTLYGAQE